MSPWLTSTAMRLSRFPRVSGDEPYLRLRGTIMGVFSPRERG